MNTVKVKSITYFAMKIKGSSKLELNYTISNYVHNYGIQLLHIC